MVRDASRAWGPPPPPGRRAASRVSGSQRAQRLCGRLVPSRAGTPGGQGDQAFLIIMTALVQVSDSAALS